MQTNFQNIASWSNKSKLLVALQDKPLQLHWAIGELRQDGAAQLRQPGFEIRFPTDDAQGGLGGFPSSWSLQDHKRPLSFRGLLSATDPQRPDVVFMGNGSFLRINLPAT